MQAFTAGLSGGFFYLYIREKVPGGGIQVKNGPLCSYAARGRVGSGLSPFINHPICG
jgi:hypothetical protein